MSWVWIPVMFVLGAIVGAILIAIVCYDNAATKEERKRWYDE